MRIIELRPGDSATAWGQAHGESFRGEIQSLADIRIYLAIKLGGFRDPAHVLSVADAHLPVLRDYDRALYDELIGIADGAGLSPAHIVVVNHYTDLRDIARSEHVDTEQEEGCSVVWARTDSGPILAQTWDMHATAMAYILMLHVPARDDRPAAWLFSITGCLGMAGVSQDGVAVAINNLPSTDAQVGIVWPALVRRALAEPSASAACELIMTSPIGSGHHYMTADASDAFGIETSGQRRKVLFESTASDRTSYLHTNHCLDSEIDQVTRHIPTSTTRDRYDWLARSIGSRPIVDIRDTWQRLGSTDGYPRSVCTNVSTPENPHGTATCGAIAMEMSRRVAWAQAGLIHNVAPRRFAFDESET